MVSTLTRIGPMFIEQRRAPQGRNTSYIVSTAARR
jgi:hypothetical protein